MVNASPCEMARPAFSFVRPRLFEVFGLQDQDLDSKTALQKIETAILSKPLKNETARPLKFH